MRQFCFLSILFFLASFLYCQEEFSFEIYFEDALGNKDTLIIGYDENGSQGLDGQFGEEDISDSSWNNVFEVRASNTITESDTWAYPNIDPPTFQSKKQIIQKPLCPDACYTISSEPPSLSIGLKSSNLPVEISWDNTLFQQDTCLLGSHLGFNIFGQVPYSGLNLTFDSPINLFEHHLEAPSYYTEENDTIRILWILFCSDHSVSTDEIDNNKADEDVVIYPNPTNSYFNVDILSNSQKLNSLEVLDINWNRIIEIKEQEYLKIIDISHFKSGIYFIKLHFASKTIIKKIIKI